jgi:hypothetical protein
MIATPAGGASHALISFLCHGQPERRQAVSVPLATKQRAAATAVAKAAETLKQAHEYLALATNAPAQRGLGCPPKGVVSLEQGKDAREGTRDAHQRLSAQRAQVTQLPGRKTSVKYVWSVSRKSSV